jgi:hypothetical protein
MKVVRLSALRTGRLYPQGNIPGTHFCQRLSRTQGHSATGRIMSMTPSGIEPATFRFVAQCLIQLRHLGSGEYLDCIYIYISIYTFIYTHTHNVEVLALSDHPLALLARSLEGLQYYSNGSSQLGTHVKTIAFNKRNSATAVWSARTFHPWYAFDRLGRAVLVKKNTSDECRTPVVHLIHHYTSTSST